MSTAFKSPHLGNPQVQQVNSELVVRPVEDWWMIGMRTIFRTRFRAEIIDALAKGAALTSAQANQRLSAVPWIEGIVTRIEPSLAGGLELFPVVRYPHALRKGYLVDLKMGHEAYLKHLASAGRRRLRRAVEKVSEMAGGEVEFREYRDVGEVREFARHAATVTLHTHQWKRNHMGITENESEVGHLEADAARNAFRGYILFANSNPIAFCSCFGVGDVLVADKIGYDASFKVSNPGFALLNFFFEHVFADRFETLDLGPDGYDYKIALATGTYEFSDVFYFRSSPKWIFWALSHRAFTILISVLSGLKARIS